MATRYRKTGVFRTRGIAAGRNWRVSGRELLQGVGGEWMFEPSSRPARQSKLPLVPTHTSLPGMPGYLAARRHRGPYIRKSW